MNTTDTVGYKIFYEPRIKPCPSSPLHVVIHAAWETSGPEVNHTRARKEDFDLDFTLPLNTSPVYQNNSINNTYNTANMVKAGQYTPSAHLKSS